MTFNLPNIFLERLERYNIPATQDKEKIYKEWLECRKTNLDQNMSLVLALRVCFPTILTDFLDYLEKERRGKVTPVYFLEDYFNT